MAYEGVSIVDYLRSVGQPSDYASRAQLAASKGIGGYSGQAQQNTQLLNMLRGSGAAPAPTQQGQTPQATPQQTQQATPTPSTGTSGGTPPPYAPDTVNQTVDYGGITWKGNPGQGWTAQSKTGGGSLSGIDTKAFNAPTINLPQLYESLYQSSGIKDLENALSTKTTAYNEQVAKIKDNPYLSEATMSGRLSKLADKFNADSKLELDKIAMQKADIETKLNLETKQFDINNQQSQQAWNQFNSLLSAGALDNASGEDIANITRATGISSGMIQSAIEQNKKKNAPKASISTFDDGENTYAIAIDDNGNVINKQLIGQSEQKSTGGGATKTEIAKQEKEQNTANLTQSVKNGITLKSLINAFSGALTIDEIYRIYNTYSPFGKAKETLAQVKQGIYATSKGGLPKKK